MSLGHVMSKDLILQTTMDKVFCKVIKSGELERLETFDICFGVIFDCYCR